MPYFVYVLRSLSDGKRYVGMTEDILRRLRTHNEGRVRATKARRPFILTHQEEFSSLQAARERERFLKTAAGRRTLDHLGK